MLLEMILIIVIGVTESISSVIPEISFNPDFVNGFESVSTLMGYMSYVVPIKTFLACLSVFFLLHNITFVIAIINWVIRKIPTIS